MRDAGGDAGCGLVVRVQLRRGRLRKTSAHRGLNRSMQFAQREQEEGDSSDRNRNNRRQRSRKGTRL